MRSHSTTPVDAHQDDLLTESEAAKVLGVDFQTVSQWGADGDLTVVTGSDGSRCYRTSEVARMLATGRHVASVPTPAPTDDDFGYEGWEDAAALLQFLRRSS